MTEIANRDTAGDSSKPPHNISPKGGSGLGPGIPHSGEPVSPDAPRSPLTEVAQVVDGELTTTLETPADPSAINPETLDVNFEPARPVGLSDAEWATVQALRGKPGQEPKQNDKLNPWQRAPLVAKIGLPLATTAAVVAGIRVASQPSAPDQGPGTVAVGTATAGVATAAPAPTPEASASNPASIALPSEAISVPITPEQAKDPVYFTSIDKFPTAALAAEEIFKNKYPAYLTSGDLTSFLKGEEAGPGDPKYLEAIFGNDGQPAEAIGIWEKNSARATLLRGYAESQTGNTFPLAITIVVKNVTPLPGNQVRLTFAMKSNAGELFKKKPFGVEESWLKQFTVPEITTTLSMKVVNGAWQIDNGVDK